MGVGADNKHRFGAAPPGKARGWEEIGGGGGWLGGDGIRVPRPRGAGLVHGAAKFGPMWGQFGANLGSMLGRSGANLEPNWGRCWTDLETMWGKIGAKLGPIGANVG